MFVTLANILIMLRRQHKWGNIFKKTLVCGIVRTCLGGGVC